MKKKEEKTVLAEIMEVVATCSPDCVAVLTDSNVMLIERDLIASLEAALMRQGIRFAGVAVTPAGEENKTLAALEAILGHLSDLGLTRRSMLICIGGGMTTDIGGFAAAIFKRGIRHLNVATTLLGAVDAAVGGKTAIDFRGLKNEIGAFHQPVATLADTDSFASLPPMEMLSGWGEVIKTAFIADEGMTRRLLDSGIGEDRAIVDEACRFCRREKMRVVEADPTEQGLRKILNFGHTAGHAIESLLLEKGMPMAHGVAVAHGILVALILSMDLQGLDKKWVTRYARWLREHYPAARFTCADYDRLLALAAHDKKNSEAGIFSFTLLRRPGEPVYGCAVTPAQLTAALDLYQELCGR